MVRKKKQRTKTYLLLVISVIAVSFIIFLVLSNVDIDYGGREYKDFDIFLYDNAFDFNNNWWCEDIVHEGLREDCFSSVPNHREFNDMTVREKRAYVDYEEQKIFDDSNFRRTIRSCERKYCDYIFNDYLRESCIEYYETNCLET